MKKIKKIMVVVLLLALCITTVTGSGTTYELEEVYYPIYANGDEVPRGDLPILNYNGNTYVPLRKLSEAAWVDVNWDDATRSISVDNGYANYYYYKYAIAEYRATAQLLYADGLLFSCSDILRNLSNSDVDLFNTKKNQLPKLIETNTTALSTLFPNGLDINYEYDEKLNNYIYFVNEYSTQINLLSEYVQGYLDGVYTYEFVLNKYLEIKNNINNNQKGYFEYLTAGEIIANINSSGY